VVNRRGEERGVQVHPIDGFCSLEYVCIRNDADDRLIARVSGDERRSGLVATAWYALPDGRYFATEKDGMSEENLKDRYYFPTLMSGKEVFGDLVVSNSTGHRSVIIAVPVVANGTTEGAIGVSLRVRLLSELVDQHMKLP